MLFKKLCVLFILKLEVGLTEVVEKMSEYDINIKVPSAEKPIKKSNQSLKHENAISNAI
jgi:hypothetical protein